MNKQFHRMGWDAMRMRHGILVRLLEQIPEDQLTKNPVPGMRTPVQIVTHIYGFAQAIAEAVPAGKLGNYDDQKAATAITTRAQLLAFVKSSWERTDRLANEVTDAQLTSIVETPWGKSFPGYMLYAFLADEQLHHRGQLYVYVRLFGREPVYVWSFEDNAPEFQPHQHA